MSSGKALVIEGIVTTACRLLDLGHGDAVVLIDTKVSLFYSTMMFSFPTLQS